MPDLISTEAPIRSGTAVPIYRGPSLALPPKAGAPDQLDLAGVRKWVRSASRPTAVDLFAGAGGLSLGLVQAGFSLLVGADSDRFSVETHRANIGGLGYCGDLSDPTDFLRHLDAWGIRRVDLIAGGVPCQPFSRAGRSKIRHLVTEGVRTVEDERAELWRSFVSIVGSLQPRSVLLENVPDLAVWDAGSVLASIRESLRSLGYSTYARVLSASDFGVPQHRERLVVVGLRPGASFQWPTGNPGLNTLADAISDLPEVPPAQRQERLPYRGPRTALQRELRTGVSGEDEGWVLDHVTRDVRPDDAEAFALLEPGQSYENLPPRLQRYRSDIFTDKYYRLKTDALCRSITAHIAKDGYWYIHPAQDRTLSIREAARVQTFPDWFRFAGQQTHRFRQIGNAVPPLLAEAVGEQIHMALMSPPIRGRRSAAGAFRDRLVAWSAKNPNPWVWRKGRSEPWDVLIAECCLGRLQAGRVAQAHAALLEAAPSPSAVLANPERLESLKAARLERFAPHVLALAEALHTIHEGYVPRAMGELLALPRVTPLVAGCVLAFGHGQRTLLGCAASERVVQRYTGSSRVDKWYLWTQVFDLAGPAGADPLFNEALLALAATVCTIQEPQCGQCPVSRACAARLQSLAM